MTDKHTSNEATLPTPYYIVYEDRLRKNLEIIRDVADRAGVKIIMALKANALWKSFNVIREYVADSTASSVNEALLSRDYLGGEVHGYCPVYTPETFPVFLETCSHITFNSLTQYDRFADHLRAWNDQHPERPVSAGVRINPQCSVIDTDLYNPCLPGSRFGVDVEQMPEQLPEGIEGLHFHALCESTSFDLEKVLLSVEENFGPWLSQVKWLNMGGGHLMTREDYNRDHLVNLLLSFRARHPHLRLIMEPGSAFTWRTGDLIVSVLDVVEKNVGQETARTAIIDASFACHMPDTLEMPYQPIISEALTYDKSDGLSYRLGGNSCLSGDYCGPWRFAEPLKPGQRLTLEDMNHYTTVKTHMFNGIQHPAIYLKPISGEPRLLRSFTYEDYRDRMD